MEKFNNKSHNKSNNKNNNKHNDKSNNESKNILKKIEEILKKYIKSIPKPIIGLTLAIIILVFPLLNNKVAIGHDYFFHATNNILNYQHLDIFKLNLTLPKIFGGTIAKGFGYATGIFYPPLSYYLTSYISYILNLTNENTVLSLSYLEILIIILSAITMYKLVKRISNDNYASMISSVAYISSTYFLCNIYTRNALAESLIFIFLPLIFYGLYELFFGNNRKFLILFTIGYIGLIFSHLVMAVFITIIILIIFMFNIKYILKKDKITKLIISSVLILLITSPYTVPLLEHKIFGNYSVFQDNIMYTNETIKEETTGITDLLLVKYKKDDGIEVYICYTTLIAALLTVIFNKKIFKNKEKYIYKTLILLIVISFLISSKYFPWDIMPSFLKMIQFPWRLCTVIIFATSILAGYMIKLIEPKYKEIIAYTIIIFMIIFGYSVIPQETIYKPYRPENMFMGNQNEYLPKNTQNNLLYYKLRNQNIILKEGRASIKTTKNETPYLKAEIELSSDLITIELPRLYYLGYQITLKDNKGKIKKIDYYENKYGFIELNLEDNGNIEVDYVGTAASKIANYISIITTMISIVILNKSKIKIK